MILPAEFVAGDTLTVYQRQLIDSGKNAPVPISGTTVTINLYNTASSTSYPTSTAITHTMTIVDVDTATVNYQFQSGDLVGPYLFVTIKVTNSLGQVVSQTNPEIFTVRPNL